MAANIRKFLEDYEDLWMVMSEYECYCMDIAFTIIEDINFLGFDFSGDNRIIQLFFMGSCDHFQFFWVGNHNYEQNLDQFPIYEIDSESPKKSLKCKGNFRTYMTKMIKDFIGKYEEKDDDNYDMAIEALSKLKKFSNDIIHENKYKPIVQTNL